MRRAKLHDTQTGPCPLSECLPPPLQLDFLVSWENSAHFLRLGLNTASLTTLLFVPHCNAGSIPVVAFTGLFISGHSPPSRGRGSLWSQDTWFIWQRPGGELTEQGTDPHKMPNNFQDVGSEGPGPTTFSIMTRCSGLASLNVSLEGLRNLQMILMN